MILAAIFVGCLAFKSSLAFPQPLNIAHSPSSSLKVLKSKVKLVPAQNTDKDPVYGILSLVETSEGVYIQVRLLSLFKVFLGCLRTVCFTDFLAEMVFWELSFFIRNDNKLAFLEENPLKYVWHVSATLMTWICLHLTFLLKCY